MGGTTGVMGMNGGACCGGHECEGRRSKGKSSLLAMADSREVIGRAANGSAPRVTRSVHPGLLRTLNNELI